MKISDDYLRVILIYERHMILKGEWGFAASREA
jgi:hypothetical protein